eukprot:12058170-Heterocapsa_arctica.AAC.1
MEKENIRLRAFIHQAKVEVQQQKLAADTAYAQAESAVYEAKQLELATTMRLAANAQAISQLAHSNKEQEATMSSMHHDRRLSAQNLELHQARDIEMLKSELHATNASEIQTLEIPG